MQDEVQQVGINFGRHMHNGARIWPVRATIAFCRVLHGSVRLQNNCHGRYTINTNVKIWKEVKSTPLITEY